MAGHLIRAWRALEFQGWRLAKSRHQHTTIRVYGDHELHVNGDDFRAYRIWRLGGSQKVKVELLRRLCEARPRLFIDVGANYGEFSIIPAEMGISCLAVEANPRVAACLRNTLSHYPNVSMVEAAAGDHAGSATFYYCTNASGSGSLASGTPAVEAEFFSKSVNTITIPMYTIDELAAIANIQSTDGVLLKIDVEGFEEEVLAGASQLLRTVAWWRAIVEFSPPALRAAGKTVDGSWSVFRRHQGYIVHEKRREVIGCLGTLPADPPKKEVDLLIGRGTLPYFTHRSEIKSTNREPNGIV